MRLKKELNINSFFVDKIYFLYQYIQSRGDMLSVLDIFDTSNDSKRKREKYEKKGFIMNLNYEAMHILTTFVNPAKVFEIGVGDIKALVENTRDYFVISFEQFENAPYREPELVTKEIKIYPNGAVYYDYYDKSSYLAVKSLIGLLYSKESIKYCNAKDQEKEAKFYIDNSQLPDEKKEKDKIMAVTALAKIKSYSYEERDIDYYTTNSYHRYYYNAYGIGMSAISTSRDNNEGDLYNTIRISFNGDVVLDKETYIPGIWEEVLEQLYNKLDKIVALKEAKEKEEKDKLEKLQSDGKYIYDNYIKIYNELKQSEYKLFPIVKNILEEYGIKVESYEIDSIEEFVLPTKYYTIYYGDNLVFKASQYGTTSKAERGEWENVFIYAFNKLKEEKEAQGLKRALEGLDYFKNL